MEVVILKITLSRDEVKEIVGKHFGLTDFILEINTERATKPELSSASTAVYTDENMLVVNKPDPSSIALKQADPDCGIDFNSIKFLADGSFVTQTHNKQDSSLKSSTSAEKSNKSPSSNSNDLVNKTNRKVKTRVDYEKYAEELLKFLESNNKELKLPLEGLTTRGAYWRYWKTKKLYDIKECKLHPKKDYILATRA